MPAVFFRIDDTDLTEFVDIQNYAVNAEDVFTSWTDANDTEHRTITRTRISGTVRLGFRWANDLESFRQLLAGSRTADGSYPVSLYVNNTGATAAIDAFIDSQGAAKWSMLAARQWITLDLTVRER